MHKHKLIMTKYYLSVALLSLANATLVQCVVVFEQVGQQTPQHARLKLQMTMYFLK